MKLDPTDIVSLASEMRRARDEYEEDMKMMAKEATAGKPEMWCGSTNEESFEGDYASREYE